MRRSLCFNLVGAAFLSKGPDIFQLFLYPQKKKKLIKKLHLKKIHFYQKKILNFYPKKPKITLSPKKKKKKKKNGAKWFKSKPSLQCIRVHKGENNDTSDYYAEPLLNFNCKEYCCRNC